MAWNPHKARECLDGSALVSFIDERDKLSAFRLRSGREIALLEENERKVSVYLSCIPQHMPDVVPDGTYTPTASKIGRHSNLELITKTLGFNHHAFKVTILSQDGLERLLAWYQYA
ncbi:hypothetical protein [Nitrosococcus wardiae]|uniref:Uncharacterized protein n=1 Tax=Nitrosococcus wardiae TaxID=1814290 RepID=A0A4P7C3I4_9GAMM|nr:hypothetical protein [Nitrosococcus wardiae]QBQ53079.1 hypothetical protein E3U44_00075 [Nitrosococcus wardiae]QBQ56359.1 hypothetical protein E3U44_19035 [Nitrosococcus wardiae]QBQ56377.1 hypothetical protein E3U44_19125 [Nitrosococcus wardiae]